MSTGEKKSLITQRKRKQNKTQRIDRQEDIIMNENIHFIKLVENLKYNEIKIKKCPN